MSFDIQFYNEAMERPESRSFANGVLYYYTHPSGWDKPMEDAIITVENEGNLVAAFVCDGMGGHAGADKAVKRIYVEKYRKHHPKNHLQLGLSVICLPVDSDDYMGCTTAKQACVERIRNKVGWS